MVSYKIVIRAVSNSRPGKNPDFTTNDEWVCLTNEGSEPVNMEGWILLNCKTDNKHYYHFYFPASIEGHAMNLEPGQSAFVITGSGKDCVVKSSDGHPDQFMFYMNKSEFIWNQAKDQVYLYKYLKDNNKEIYELVARKEITVG